MWIPGLSLDLARSSMSWRIHLMWGNWTLFCHLLFRLVVSVLWDHLLCCLRNLTHTNLVQWSHAFVRNPWSIHLCFCTVQLLDSRLDSVFPGVRYLCIVPSLLFACPCSRWAFPYLFPLFIIFFSSITPCYRFSVSLSTPFLAIFFRSFLFAVSRVSSFFFFFFFWIGRCIWHFRAKCQFAYRRTIVYCFLRKSLGCLNWLVCMALLGEVSIGWSQVWLTLPLGG